MYCLQGMDGHKKPKELPPINPPLLSKAGRSGWVPGLSSLSHSKGSEGHGRERDNPTDRSRSVRGAQENTLDDMEISSKVGEVVTSLNNSYKGGRFLNEYESFPSLLPVCHLTAVLTKLSWQQSISLLTLQW